jgi:hypothetical protein
MRLVVLGCVLGLVVPGAAVAHGDEAAHGYTSEVERIVNGKGIEAHASGDGHFSLTVPAGPVVIVNGADGAPFVRFAGGKVFESTSAGAPEWVVVREGQTHTWRDRRTYWAAAEPPEAVHEDPDAAHHIRDWTIGGTVDGQPFTIDGSLEWGPKAKSGPGYTWISLLVIGGGVLYAAFLLFAKRGRPAKTA